MSNPQAGIFALGNVAHTYLEFDLKSGQNATSLVAAVAGLDELRTTTSGVNVVMGFRPELWSTIAPTPAQLDGFNAPIVGSDGFTMPATQHDLAAWIAGASYDVVFDAARGTIAAIGLVAEVASEVVGWSYHHDLDLTGFIYGTENPSLSEAPEVVLVPKGLPAAGGSVLLLQQWVHRTDAWTALDVEEQEQVIGRAKPDSLELDPQPPASHVARTDQDTFGHIFRRNTAYGSVTDHGTMFVGFCADQGPLDAMLQAMAGIGGARDELTRYSTPLTGAYYFVPSLDDLRVTPER